MPQQRVIGALLFLAGLCLAAFSLRDLAAAPSVSALRAERAAMAAWPSVPGSLEEVHIQQELHAARGSLWFSAEARYRYTVGGGEHTGTRISIQPYRDTAPEAVEALMGRFLDPRRIVSRTDSDSGPPMRSRRITLLLRNQPVQVHYDPRDPAVSLLDTTDRDPPAWWKPWVPVLAFVPLGGVLMVIGAILWRGRMAPAHEAGSHNQRHTIHPALRHHSPQEPREKDWLDELHTADLACAAGRYEESLAAYTRARDRAPGEAGTQHAEIRIRLGMGRCLAALGSRIDAGRLLDEVIARAQGIPGPEAKTIVEEARGLKRDAERPGGPTVSPGCISPWADSAVLASPDGAVTARISDAAEIGMGGPTSGMLRLSNGMTLPDCNPAMIWSADSRYLAVPQWTDNGSQRLSVLEPATRSVRYVPGRYRLLALERFENGIVTGQDSPKHDRRPVRIDVSNIEWPGGKTRGGT